MGCSKPPPCFCLTSGLFLPHLGLVSASPLSCLSLASALILPYLCLTFALLLPRLGLIAKKLLLEQDGYMTCPFQAGNIFILRLFSRDESERKVWKTRLVQLLRLTDTLTSGPACSTA